MGCGFRSLSTCTSVTTGLAAACMGCGGLGTGIGMGMGTRIRTGLAPRPGPGLTRPQDEDGGLSPGTGTRIRIGLALRPRPGLAQPQDEDLLPRRRTGASAPVLGSESGLARPQDEDRGLDPVTGTRIRTSLAPGAQHQDHGRLGTGTWTGGYSAPGLGPGSARGARAPDRDRGLGTETSSAPGPWGAGDQDRGTSPPSRRAPLTPQPCPLPVPALRCSRTGTRRPCGRSPCPGWPRRPPRWW